MAKNEKEKKVIRSSILDKYAKDAEKEHMDFLEELTASYFEGDENDEDDEGDEKDKGDEG
jgi:hypothetical protein